MEKIKAVMLKMDNGYNAAVITCTDALLLTGKSSAIIMNRSWHSIKKGEFFISSFVMGPKGNRQVILNELVVGKPPSFAVDASTIVSASKVTTIAPTVATTATPAAPTVSPTSKPKVAPTVSLGGIPFAQNPTVVAGEPKEKPMPKVNKKNSLKGYYISPETRIVFSTVHEMLTKDPLRSIKVMMTGPSGYGKTTMPRLFAEMTDRSYHYVNCGSMRDPEEWFGYREARAGSTVFIRSEFAKAIEAGNCVIVLDEFNRIEPYLHNTLFPLLDERGKTTVHDELFQTGKNVVIVGTINTGYQYTGTFELDTALANRFDFHLECEAMPHNDEVGVLRTQTGISGDDAGSIVKTANVLRAENIVCSTRSTLDVARMVVSGMDIRDAFEFAVVRRIPKDDSGTGLRKQVIDMVNSRHSAFAPESALNRIRFDVFSTEKPKTEPEVAAVAPAVGKTSSVTVSNSSGESYKYIQFLEFLKHLPLVAPVTVFKTAKKICDDIKDGKTVVVDFTQEMDAASLIEKLKSFGLTGTYRKA